MVCHQGHEKLPIYVKIPLSTTDMLTLSLEEHACQEEEREHGLQGIDLVSKWAGNTQEQVVAKPACFDKPLQDCFSNKNQPR